MAPSTTRILADGYVPVEHTAAPPEHDPVNPHGIEQIQVACAGGTAHLSQGQQYPAFGSSVKR